MSRARLSPNPTNPQQPSPHALTTSLYAQELLELHRQRALNDIKANDELTHFSIATRCAVLKHMAHRATCTPHTKSSAEPTSRHSSSSTPSCAAATPTSNTSVTSWSERARALLFHLYRARCSQTGSATTSSSTARRGSSGSCRLWRGTRYCRREARCLLVLYRVRHLTFFVHSLN